MEFKDLDPILHNELRLKVMAALDSLADADFVYLKELTKATAGNLSVQITKLEEAGYIKVPVVVRDGVLIPFAASLPPAFVPSNSTSRLCCHTFHDRCFFFCGVMVYILNFYYVCGG